MKLLDRYIIGKFLGTFFYTALIFTMIATVVDYSERAERLMVEKVPGWQIISEYYLNFIPWINSLLWPIFVLIAVIYFTSRLAKDSEFIAVFNAGISFYRLLVPYMISALFLTGLLLAGAHYVVPKANKVKFGFENKYISKDSDKGQTRDVHISINPGTQVFVRYYNKGDTTARDVRIEEYKEHRLVKVTVADRIEWVAEPHQWKIEDYTVRTYEDINETLEVFKGRDTIIPLAIQPDDFSEFKHQKDGMTSPQLLQYIHEEKSKGRANTEIYEAEYHRRTADAVSIIILTLIGAAIASRKVRGGVGLHLARGIIIGAVYIFLSKLSITFAVSSVISTSFAVWIPNIVFGFLSVYLIMKAQK